MSRSGPQRQPKRPTLQKKSASRGKHGWRSEIGLMKRRRPHVVLGRGLQAVYDRAHFFLMFLFLRGLDPISDDDHLIFYWNEGDADRGRAVLILALKKKLRGIEPTRLEFVLFLGGIVEDHVPAF